MEYTELENRKTTILLLKFTSTNGSSEEIKQIEDPRAHYKIIK